jgi:MYXO-CTERM domain-containing protein
MSAQLDPDPLTVVEHVHSWHPGRDGEAWCDGCSVVVTGDPTGGAVAWLLLSLAVVLVIGVPIVVFALLGGKL